MRESGLRYGAEKAGDNWPLFVYGYGLMGGIAVFLSRKSNDMIDGRGLRCLTQKKLENKKGKIVNALH